ncbi:hypothetical protein K505DRAFT_411744 [Melanomma pulvis-pyrius CBS 109.77]|uniref:Uncharacterized protein n=1 Tax=Melanomma pulvis-pyrius CBS 109.77 TaxID=1314802 RepID=A0A6A6WSE2_9PLEO|nr:hypothetical protein K505DRAFT_411744 [Melanomma pulvis-pyrius CBS 109.77]
MAALWIVISTRWDLSSLQASLNVIISALGTIGLWAFTRFWWRRGCNSVLRKNTASLGEGWDAMVNWHLLLQLIVVVVVTLTCALAGPIAKVSLKNGLTVTHKQLQVLPAEVLWNDTAHSLINAGFPDSQLLDFLPPLTTPPWIYVASEWDPTWTINNVTGSGNHDFYHPVDAFSLYRESYNPAWLESSKYRVTSDFDSFAIFVTLIQSDPEIDDRMHHNNETLDLSISLLHASDFKNWKPTGPIGHASYSRADCTITRKAFVQNPDQIPWPWTNDTGSIAKGFTTYYMAPFFGDAVKKQPVTLPSSRELLQFYQIYMASVNTLHSNPAPRTLSVKVQTVELSVIFLVVLIILTLLTAWNSARLEELYLPDGRIEWMIHAVKTSEVGIDLESNADWKRKDSEHFCTAVIGADLHPGVAPFDAGIQVPRLARVRSCRSSTMSERPSRRFSVSPARSNLGSVSEVDSIETNKIGRPSSDASSHRLRPSLSALSHPPDKPAKMQEKSPTLQITTNTTPSPERTVTRSQTTWSTLGVPRQSRHDRRMRLTMFPRPEDSEATSKKSP